MKLRCSEKNGAERVQCMGIVAYLSSFDGVSSLSRSAGIFYFLYEVGTNQMMINSWGIPNPYIFGKNNQRLLQLTSFPSSSLL
jgi:hypothetical protein